MRPELECSTSSSPGGKHRQRQSNAVSNFLGRKCCREFDCCVPVAISRRMTTDRVAHVRMISTPELLERANGSRAIHPHCPYYPCLTDARGDGIPAALTRAQCVDVR